MSMLVNVDLKAKMFLKFLKFFLLIPICNNYGNTDITILTLTTMVMLINPW